MPALSTTWSTLPTSSKEGFRTLHVQTNNFLGLQIFISGVDMQRLGSSLSQCRRSSLLEFLHPERWTFAMGPYETRRFRSVKASRKKAKERVRQSGDSHSGGSHRSFSKPQHHTGSVDPPAAKQDVDSLLQLSEDDPEGIIDFCAAKVRNWTNTPRLAPRLISFGLPAEELGPILSKFVDDIEQRVLLNNQHAYDDYGFRRLAHFSPDIERPLGFLDIIFTSMFYSWAADKANQAALEAIVPLKTIESMRRLVESASRLHPADEYPLARKMRRKIIMHVGPTNSGKTYHALRALAAARKGCYAGPLRLLAHEIWERLNLGLIVPLGAEEEPTSVAAAIEPLPESAAEQVESPAPAKIGNPKYARLCNMLTGEEHKIVSDTALLSSCTVEMLSYAMRYDVAVIDEIQLISDEERGNAWTSAVLGIAAKEVHLCGEETAVPIVRALLRHTGEEIIVKRYKRLTPLVPEKKSLENDIKNIRKGDCVVAFSRNRIFSLRERVEAKTGLRCAVVYGKLPPEIRSRQAELFNDPANEHDVIIGSDAIGMGLNLYVYLTALSSSTASNPCTKKNSPDCIRIGREIYKRFNATLVCISS